MNIKCGLSGHKWFEDLGTFSSSTRCERCKRHKDPVEGERFDYELSCWADCSRARLPYTTSVAVVVQRMAQFDVEHPTP